MRTCVFLSNTCFTLCVPYGTQGIKTFIACYHEAWPNFECYVNLRYVMNPYIPGWGHIWSNSEHIHASDKYILSFISVRSFANKKGLTSSCHPNHVTSNIPYSLALRITRICSEPETRDLRHSELRELLLERDYKLGCTIFSKRSQIKPTFLHSMCMCIVEIRSHAKFQVSSFKDLSWPPLFVNQSWHWESHLKWPGSGTFDLSPFIEILHGTLFHLYTCCAKR